VILSPTSVDFWVAFKLAGLLGGHPLFDRCVESGIHHNVLGGVWYAAALFILWSRAVRPGGEFARRRILTTLAGTLIAILFTLLAGALISWPPPYHHPHLYPIYSQYFEPNPNTNSFPSQSTTVYTCIAAGIYSLNRPAGMLLWGAVALLVALPRMYVGGHYLSDVIAGLILGLAGYIIARRGLEQPLISRVEHLIEGSATFRTAAEIVVFVWILQVAVEFREANWFWEGMGTLRRALSGP
jgi:membrane-associated phospholipid phosphatase